MDGNSFLKIRCHRPEEDGTKSIFKLFLDLFFQFAHRHKFSDVDGKGGAGHIEHPTENSELRI